MEGLEAPAAPTAPVPSQHSRGMLDLDSLYGGQPRPSAQPLPALYGNLGQAVPGAGFVPITAQTHDLMGAPIRSPSNSCSGCKLTVGLPLHTDSSCHFGCCASAQTRALPSTIGFLVLSSGSNYPDGSLDYDMYAA